MRRLLRDDWQNRLWLAAFVWYVAGDLLGGPVGDVLTVLAFPVLLLWMVGLGWAAVRSIRAEGWPAARRTGGWILLAAMLVALSYAFDAHGAVEGMLVGFVGGFVLLVLVVLGRAWWEGIRGGWSEEREKRRRTREEAEAWYDEMRHATPVRIVGPGDPDYKASRNEPYVPLNLRVLGPGSVTAPAGRCGAWPDGEVIVDSSGTIVAAPNDVRAHEGAFAQCYAPVGHDGPHTWQARVWA